MLDSTFERVRRNLDEACFQELARKGPDYVLGQDRLGNFKEIAIFLDLSPLQVWAIYMLKHLFAVLKYVRTGKLSSEKIMGRFIDLRNYIDLGWALIEDENEP